MSVTVKSKVELKEDGAQTGTGRLTKKKSNIFILHIRN